MAATTTYLVTPFRSVRLWAPLVSLLLLLGLCIAGMLEWGVERMWPLTALVGGVLLLFLLGACTERVTFTESGVTYRSLTTRYTYDWSALRYWGYVRHARYGNTWLGIGDAMTGKVYVFLGTGSQPGLPDLMKVSDQHTVLFCYPEVVDLLSDRLGAPVDPRGRTKISED